MGIRIQVSQCREVAGSSAVRGTITLWGEQQALLKEMGWRLTLFPPHPPHPPPRKPKVAFAIFLLTQTFLL